MKMKWFQFVLALSCIASSAAFLPSAFAQDAQPRDGEMVKIRFDALWKLQYLPNAPVRDAAVIARDLKSPSISPDGSQVVMFKRGLDGEPNALSRWSRGDVQTIVRDEQVSMFITWNDEKNISVRQFDRPFFENGEKLNFTLNGKGARLRDRKPLRSEAVRAFDADDVILLVRQDTRTLQAISDTSSDRYFGPVVSPDSRFVVYNGLTTGVHLFDVEANAVVFIGLHGTHPTFSPDGRYLMYTDTRDDGHTFTQGNLVVIDLREKTFRFVSNPDGEIRIHGTLSRDGRFVAYETDDGRIMRAGLFE